jgi:hypothetical protein
LEVRATGGLDRNQIYNILMTMARDMRLDCSVLTVDTRQLGTS